MFKLDFKVNQDIEIKDFLSLNKFSNKLITYYLHNQHLILLNNHELNTYNLKENDILTITFNDEESNINIIEGNINIIYEDEYILILNKPKNIAVNGTMRHYKYHLSGMIYKYFLDNNIKSTVHFVNRLDYETSGLIIIAKHQYIHHLFNYVNINKYYYCIVEGLLENKKGLIDKPILKLENDPKKRIIDEKGKRSLTEYEVIQEFNNFSLINVHLLTGRTHQIRLHFSSINHPLVGDYLYGSQTDNNNDILLFSYHLDFIHPITNKKIDITLPLNDDFNNFITKKKEV